MTTAKQIMSTDFPRLKRIEELEELEGKCHELWLLNGGETQEWNGDTCDCGWIQGNLNCKRHQYEDLIFEKHLPTNT